MQPCVVRVEIQRDGNAVAIVINGRTVHSVDCVLVDGGRRVVAKLTDRLSGEVLADHATL